jgi:hypothetical protein
MKPKATWHSVLVYKNRRVHQGKIRKYYEKWRLENGRPKDTCDNEECQLHREPALWNEKPIKMTLDHKNGVHLDNNPENLRLLCPNCDSQLTTRGGLNKGRVIGNSDNGYVRRNEDKARDYVYYPSQRRTDLLCPYRRLPPWKAVEAPGSNNRKTCSEFPVR